MATPRTYTTRSAPSWTSLLARLATMVGVVVALVLVSTPFRQIDPLQLRIAINILFFVALGMLDEWLMAPVLNRWPLARAAVIVAATLALGWFFTPGGVSPASKFLFYTHIVPFFVAVLLGALIVLAVRRRQRW